MTMPAIDPPRDLEAAKAAARSAAERFDAASKHFDPGWLSIGANDPRRVAYERAFAEKQRAEEAVAEAERAAKPQPPSVRQQLCDAVARLRAARAELTSARAAQASSSAAVTEARAAVTGMESAVAKARHDAVAHATNVASGKPGDPPMPVAQAKAMLGAAQEHLGVVQDADAGLEVRLKRAMDALAMAEIRFNRTRGEYLKQAPVVFDLLRRLHAAECEVAGLAASPAGLQRSPGSRLSG
jgi:hypothetical protein